MSNDACFEVVADGVDGSLAPGAGALERPRLKRFSGMTCVGVRKYKKGDRVCSKYVDTFSFPSGGLVVRLRFAPVRARHVELVKLI